MELQFTPAAIKAIAHKALSRRTGARGLRSILEILLLDAMFDTPGSLITAVYVDEDVVAGKKHPEYVMVPRTVEKVEDDFSNDKSSSGFRSQEREKAAN